MVGAVAGAPGTLPTNWSVGGTTTGLTREIVGTGTEDGITYIDVRFSGTAGAALNPNVIFEVSNATAALNGQIWTNSFYLSLVGGSLSNVTNIIPVVSMFNSTPTLIGVRAGPAITPTNAALRTQRNSFAATLNQAATAFTYSQIQFSVANGLAIDITLRIGLPQLELGAFATSVIPTTTAATTRSADLASIGTLSPWYNASAGTIYAEFQTPITGNAFQASFNDATANNRVGILSSSSQFVAARNTGGAGVLFTPGTANAPSLVNVNKSALAFANTDYALCGNGGTVATASTYNVPTVTRLELGQQLTATLLNGYLRRITYTPRRLTDAELQSLTS
jgi:hypothetical protein